MNSDGMHITRHALERFKRRWPHPAQPTDWMRALKALLDRAQEEDIGSGRTIRLINNGLQPARYFEAEGWRFVTDENAERLYTCERIIFKARKKPKFKRRK